jgi:hypothetical protein
VSARLCPSAIRSLLKLLISLCIWMAWRRLCKKLLYNILVISMS